MPFWFIASCDKLLKYVCNIWCFLQIKHVISDIRQVNSFFIYINFSNLKKSTMVQAKTLQVQPHPSRATSQELHSDYFKYLCRCSWESLCKYIALWVPSASETYIEVTRLDRHKSFSLKGQSQNFLSDTQTTLHSMTEKLLLS